MAELNPLERARNALDEMKKKIRYNKANTEREKAAALQYDLMVCRSQLEGIRKDLDRTIRAQSRNIREGQLEKMNTSVQVGILREAALSYILVKDAIYSLKTVNSYDSVSYAYELLDAAVAQMTGKQKGKKDPFAFFSQAKRRPEYAQLTSAETLQKKVSQRDNLMTDLINTGDIETCLSNGPKTASDGQRQYQYQNDGKTPGTSSDLYAKVNGLPDDASAADDNKPLETPSLGKVIDKA